MSVPSGCTPDCVIPIADAEQAVFPNLRKVKGVITPEGETLTARRARCGKGSLNSASQGQALSTFQKSPDQTSPVEPGPVARLSLSPGRLSP
jgi:hypothetical protein